MKLKKVSILLIVIISSTLFIGCDLYDQNDENDFKVTSANSEKIVEKKEPKASNLEQKAYCVSNEYKNAVTDYVRRDLYLNEVFSQYNSSFYTSNGDICYAIVCDGMYETLDKNKQCSLVDIFNNDYYQIFVNFSSNREKLDDIIQGLKDGTFNNLDDVAKEYGPFLGANS